MAKSHGRLEEKYLSYPCACCTSCSMWCWRAIKWLPVILIVTIVGWSYYAYVLQLCIYTIESPIQKIAYLAVYHFLMIMFMWSYMQTIYSSPVVIPEKYKLPESYVERLLSTETEEGQRAILEEFAKDLTVVTRTSNGALRYCNRCVLIKPDRAHHCSICARCVMKMDHHCPWVNNCVCYQNYKYFMLFLGYALLYCTWIWVTCFPYFISFWKGQYTDVMGTGKFHVVFAFFVAMMFGISLGSLFGYHCFLVLNNRTTLEAFRAPTFRGGPDKNGFSLGAYKNFKQIFGDQKYLWFIPVFSSLGDGCEYPVHREHQLQPLPVQEPGYDSMGTTAVSIGGGITFPLPKHEEDAESLLNSEQWDRWEERRRQYDANLDSSYDEL